MSECWFPIIGVRRGVSHCRAGNYTRFFNKKIVFFCFNLQITYTELRPTSTMKSKEVQEAKIRPYDCERHMPPPPRIEGAMICASDVCLSVAYIGPKTVYTVVHARCAWTSICKFTRSIRHAIRVRRTGAS